MKEHVLSSCPKCEYKFLVTSWEKNTEKCVNCNYSWPIRETLVDNLIKLKYLRSCFKMKDELHNRILGLIESGYRDCTPKREFRMDWVEHGIEYAFERLKQRWKVFSDKILLQLEQAVAEVIQQGDPWRVKR